MTIGNERSDYGTNGVDSCMFVEDPLDTAYVSLHLTLFPISTGYFPILGPEDIVAPLRRILHYNLVSSCLRSFILNVTSYERIY